MRKEFPSDKLNARLEFSTMRPRERYASIRQGLNVRLLSTATSSYTLIVRH